MRCLFWPCRPRVGGGEPGPCGAPLPARLQRRVPCIRRTGGQVPRGTSRQAPLVPQGHRHTTDASLERIRTDLSPKGLSPSSSSTALSATKHIGKHRCKMQKGPVPLHTGTAALRASTSPAPTSPRWERPASVWQISELGHAIGAGTPTDVRWKISRRGGAIKIQFGLPVFHLLSF